MIDRRFVIPIDRARRVKQRCQQVFLDIEHLIGVFAEAFHHVLNVKIIQLQELGFHQFFWILITGDQNRVPLRQHCLKNQIQNPLHQLLLIRIPLQQALVLDIVLDDLCVCSPIE